MPLYRGRDKSWQANPVPPHVQRVQRLSGADTYHGRQYSDLTKDNHEAFRTAYKVNESRGNTKGHPPRSKSDPTLRGRTGRQGSCDDQAPSKPYIWRAEQQSFSRSSVASSSSDGALISCKAVTAPPGYAGYAPGVHAENVFGRGFNKTNKSAKRDVQAYRRGSIPKFEPPPRRNSGGYSKGAEIPGYSGHIPGFKSGSLTERCVPRAAKAHWNPQDHGSFPRIMGTRGDHHYWNKFGATV